MKGDASGRGGWAVILARGDSRRMGIPKGLCRLRGSDRTFLESLIDLYCGFGLPVAVVTLPGLIATYSDSLAEPGAIRWIGEDRGGGTARTALAAVRALADETPLLWLHPVDVPLVAASTLSVLADRSEHEPGSVVIPVHGGAPGHPVLLPTAPFAAAAARPRDQRGSMRTLLSESGSAPLLRVEVPDSGVITDFAIPADLDRAGP